MRNVLSDILPYLGVAPDYTGEDAERINVVVPDVCTLTEQEAAALLSGQNLGYTVRGEGGVVTDQLPQPGAEIPGTSSVILYMGESAPTEHVAVPDLTACSADEAENYLEDLGLYLQTKGASRTESGDVIITDQDILAGTKVKPGSVITAELTDVTAKD